MKYLSEQEIIKINRYVIHKYSPSEPVGVIHSTALNMIVETPKQNVFGKELYPGVIEKSAFIFKSIIQKHVFINGNKRTAFLALNMFLNMNGYKLNVDKVEAVSFTVKVATESLTDKEINTWIGTHTEKMI
ncbi:type II toxin-antitoxin system death-on-curing family toxin [Lacicoccus alkaliphilus]|uniref:Death on curing protein n=1 Tax=Lacicoccus alkaliphilus DSM 16010 TaxID=1123231 RepID=A0A1M7BVE6_9BACL|nr:type II toxin-antitoxin system death-on-curing family toxin [Salinicoccus alkaliphilus]SHL58907.1 death on curing protein [Salinicoccus alkaliphilus DSM 16010]